MTTNVERIDAEVDALPGYREILLAVDSSDHANQGVSEGVSLAQLWGARVTAAHVYAAKMHDMRFRQMEGGLPEKFRQEQELERQRDVHDTLITRGLSIITDCYLDRAEGACQAAGLSFARRSLEGKNYRQLVNEANGGGYDLLVLGALGVGAVAGSQLGSVCDRVVRRTDIDTLVIKSPQRSVAEGPIVVAVDGSPRAFGGLLTALSLARSWQVPVHVVSAFDPYYHYVAFNRIAAVLSEEAGKVFRFKEQERLHEEIIDSGLAKIYAGHLEIARDIAAEHGVAIETKLLDGKPHDAIARYLHEQRPSLLVVGKLGIHADPELDIGGNAENLLRAAECAVLLSQREYRPRTERLAEVTTSWTHEAESRMQRVPSFVQNMARMAILRYAQERGHTVITARIVEEATAALMPGRAEQAMEEIVAAHDRGDLDRAALSPDWSVAAREQLERVEPPSLRANLRLRAEKKARAARAAEVSCAHLQGLIDPGDQPQGTETTPLHWEAAALARLAQVPEGFMRDASRKRIEQHARNNRAGSVTLEIVEVALAQAREAMGEAAGETTSAGARSRCPFAASRASVAEAPAPEHTPVWTQQATARLETVPQGYCRRLTERAVSTLAAQQELREIDVDFVERVLAVFKNGSQSAETAMPWASDARARIERAPDAVRGMLVREIESWAQRHGLAQVDARAVRAIKREWQARGVFHLDPADPRSGA